MLTGEYICQDRKAAGVEYPQHIWHWDKGISGYRCDYCRKVRQPQPDAIMPADWIPSA